MATLLKVNNTLIPINITAPLGTFSGNLEDAVLMRQASLFTEPFYSNSTVSYIADMAFAYCNSLTSINFTQCQEIGSYAFADCRSLTTAIFPECDIIGLCAFYNCYNLSIISFPKSTLLSNYAFYSCSKLTMATFSKCSHIYSSVFTFCVSLFSLYLLTSSIPTLSDTSTFYSTPISTYGSIRGSIFVKASLLTAFKTATN
ncbi:MAG: leucine-rich repeat domain-containing protein [Bacilli bacterium]|nr:leucine-rich repeat domain-containing protein [Bacilli bacterium]